MGGRPRIAPAERRHVAKRVLPAPQAVGFDLGDTLIEYEGVHLDWQHDYPAALAEIAAACGRTPSDRELAAATRVLLAANTRVTPRQTEVRHTEVFGGVLAALGFEPEARATESAGEPSCAWADLVERATAAFFAVFRRRLHAMPGAIALLDELEARRVPVGVLSDVPYGMPRHLVLEDLEAAGLSRLAGVTLTSVQVGARKPATDGFRTLAQQVGVLPKDMWFVGNEYRDAAGAKAAGMVSVLLWRSAEPAPSWGQDLVVTCLEDLRLMLRSVLLTAGPS